MNPLWFWLDLIWIPVAVLVTHQGQRAVALGFVILTLMTVRLQAELIEHLGAPDGLVPFYGDSAVIFRGQLIYGLFTGLYLLLLWASPRSPWSVILSASIVIYIAAFTVTMAVMAI